VRAYVVIAVVVAACSANDDIPAPRIASITPDHGMAGASVTIDGDFFCHQLESEDPLLCEQQGTVHFGTAVADVISYADAMIVADVPNIIGKVRVTVDVAGEVSNGIDFTVE
jgi:hypothetical protein